MQISTIDNFKLGQSIKGFYLCKKKLLQNTRSNKLYIEMILTDSTGSIPAVMWNLVEEFKLNFKKGDPVAVKGKITEYNNSFQLSITNINQATSNRYGKYGFIPEDLIR